MSLKSIIFDMDGTLLDSSYAMLQSVNHVRAHLGLEPTTKDFLEYNINQPDKNLPKLFYETEGYVPEHKDMFKAHYLENANLHVKAYDGAKELLEFLHVKNISINIATNAADIFAINMLKHQGFLEYFNFIAGSNLVKNPKPNPEMIYYLKEKTDIALEETLLVGDSIKDELAAKNANIHFAFANWGYGVSKDAKYQFNSLAELQKYLVSIL